MEVLSAWLKSNSGDVAARFGITVQQMQGVINNYENAYTMGVANVLLVGAGVTAIGVGLAWFAFGKE